MTQQSSRVCVYCARTTTLLRRRDHDGFTWECVDRENCAEAAREFRVILARGNEHKITAISNVLRDAGPLLDEESRRLVAKKIMEIP